VPGGEEVETEVEARPSLDFPPSMVTGQELCDSTKNLPREIEGCILGGSCLSYLNPDLVPETQSRRVNNFRPVEPNSGNVTK
jgi:hypothetical protein